MKAGLEKPVLKWKNNLENFRTSRTILEELFGAEPFENLTNNDGFWPNSAPKMVPDPPPGPSLPGLPKRPSLPGPFWLPKRRGYGPKIGQIWIPNRTRSEPGNLPDLEPKLAHISPILALAALA